VVAKKGIYRTPKIYLHDYEEEIPLPRAVTVVGFVGLAERGPLNCPQKLTGWGQYGEIFGPIQGDSFLGPAVYGFFSNGGEICYVTRVADTETEAKRPIPASYLLYSSAGNGVVRLDAANEGKWGNHISIRVETGKENVPLTTLTKAASPGVDVLWVRSNIDLYPSTDLVIIRSDDITIREEKEIVQVLPGNRVQLKDPLAKGYPEGSRVLGRGFHLHFGYEKRKESFLNLSLDPEHERFLERVINGDETESSYVTKASKGHSVLIRAKVTPYAAAAPARPFRADNPVVREADGRDPVVPIDYKYFTGYQDGAYFPNPHPGAQEYQGLATMELLEDLDLVAIPDLNEKSLTAGTDLKFAYLHALTHCHKMGNRFALLDAPPLNSNSNGHSLVSLAEQLGYSEFSGFGAMYFPRIQVAPIEGEEPKSFIPPSGHVAGIYGRTDREQGVHKAPANELIQGVFKLESPVDDALQDLLNPAGVNCIRSFPGRGIRVWGARTLSRNSAWRYVTVRRIHLLIVKGIQRNLRWTVFEPNDPRLWAGITATLSSFLAGLHQKGTLAGATPQEAFHVKCDAETNPPEAVARGETRAEIGFAPVFPAEFIVLIIKRTPGSLEVKETG